MVTIKVFRHLTLNLAGSVYDLPPGIHTVGIAVAYHWLIAAYSTVISGIQISHATVNEMTVLTENAQPASGGAPGSQPNLLT